MTIDEMILFLQSVKNRESVQLFSDGAWRDWNYDVCGNPMLDGVFDKWRVKPQPRQPKEWWIEPLKYGLCRMHNENLNCTLWHVREVIE